MAFYAWRTLSSDRAKRWLFRRWAALPVNLGMVETYCEAAIYDQNDSRKRIFTIGAAYLVEEDRGDKGRVIKSQKMQSNAYAGSDKYRVWLTANIQIRSSGCLMQCCACREAHGDCY